MKKTLMSFLLAVFWHTAAAVPVTYDFTAPGAGALDGEVNADFIVDGSPLNIQAGTSTLAGDFTMGGSSLYDERYGGVIPVDSQISAAAGGLGVSSVHGDTGAIVSGDQVGPGEAILFNFDANFAVSTLTLNFFLDQEDVRVFGDGGFLFDYTQPASAPSLTHTMDLSSYDVSSVMLLTQNCKFSCLGHRADEANSDFFVSAVSGDYVPVPEPGLWMVTVLGLMSLPWLRKNTNHNG